tara:strand:- start:38 stop:358 length:321 start_codon:yes stop_codon:yes gene_type:complete
MAHDATVSAALTGTTGQVALRVKVVPGASRSRVMGMLGDRLKLSVAAAPEAGKANKAVCALIAEVLGVPTRDVTVSAGTTHPKKTLTIAGLTLQQAVTRLGKAVPG